MIDRAVQNTNPAELDVSSLGNRDPKELAELGLSQEDLLNRKNNRAIMSKDEQNARQYQEAVKNLFRINVELIAEVQSRIDLLGKDAINNPNLTPTQRQDLLNWQLKESVEMQKLGNAAQQRFEFLNHITDLVEQGKFQDILNLQNGEKFELTNIGNQLAEYGLSLIQSQEELLNQKKKPEEVARENLQAAENIINYFMLTFETFKGFAEK